MQLPDPKVRLAHYSAAHAIAHAATYLLKIHHEFDAARGVAGRLVERVISLGARQDCNEPVTLARVRAIAADCEVAHQEVQEAYEMAEVAHGGEAAGEKLTSAFARLHDIDTRIDQAHGAE